MWEYIDESECEEDASGEILPETLWYIDKKVSTPSEVQ